VTDIHLEMRSWRQHLKDNRVVEITSRIQMPHFGEFIGE